MLRGIVGVHVNGFAGTGGAGKSIFLRSGRTQGMHRHYRIAHQERDGDLQLFVDRQYILVAVT